MKKYSFYSMWPIYEPVKLTCNLKDIPKAIEKYNDDGFKIVGVKFDLASDICELVYESADRTTEDTSKIHLGDLPKR